MSGPDRQDPIYLDNAASTQPAAEVVEAMLPWLRALHANPNSDHLHGQRAFAAVEEARSRVAKLIGAAAEDIVFTSGATESNNIAILGRMARSEMMGQVATTAIEHKSIVNVARELERRGSDVVLLPVDANGRVRDKDLMTSLEAEGPPGPRLLALAHANSEIGTVQDLHAISRRVEASDWDLHVDAAQSAGKLALDVESWPGITSLSVSSHKLFGPTGIGALYLAPGYRDRLSPLMFGGGQEGGLRPGSISPFLAVGFGMAAALARDALAARAQQAQALAGAFLEGVLSTGVEVLELGDRHHRLPGHLCLRFPGCDAADLLQRVAPYLSASQGSACSSGQIGASHVLRGIGLTDEQAGQVIRVCFGPGLTFEHARQAAALLAQAVQAQAA